MKKPVKENVMLSWHTLELKHQEICDKLSLYLEARTKKPIRGSGLAPWRNRPAKTADDHNRLLW